VARINKTLDKLDLEFRHLNDESTGREMYALVWNHLFLNRESRFLVSNLQVNRKGDEIAQMATDYSAVEIAFFKAIVRLLSTPTFLFTASVSTTRSSK